MLRHANAQRDALLAVKLADGTYLIRSGCCSPGRCAPAAQQRCCRSVRCECDWPDMYRGFGAAPTPQRGWPAARNVTIVCLVLLSSTLVAGVVLWFVVANIVAVVAAIFAAGLVIAGLNALRGRSRRSGGGGYTVNNYYR